MNTSAQKAGDSLTMRVLTVDVSLGFRHPMSVIAAIAPEGVEGLKSAIRMPHMGKGAVAEVSVIPENYADLVKWARSPYRGLPLASGINIRPRYRLEDAGMSSSSRSGGGIIIT